MTRPLVPVADLERRLPEAGRIRIGIRKGRYPSKIDTFRFTSGDEEAINQVAELYGGEPHPWKEFAGRWEVITPAKTLKIALPPDPLGGTPIYELWAKGGCERRCNGVSCLLMTGGGPEGADPMDSDCLCAHRGELACKLTTRLHVLLPGVRFTGVWGLVSGSWAVAQEMPGMVDVIAQMQDRGIQRAELRLEQRRGPKGPVFIPALGFDQTLDALASGASRMRALPAADEQTYTDQQGNVWTDVQDGQGVFQGPGGDPLAFPSSSDDIIDAEIVEPTAGPPIPVAAYHEDPAIVQAWKDALTTTQQNKVLRLVRDSWGLVDGTLDVPEGTPPPQTFDDIPPEVIGTLIDRGVPANEG